jgi:hypothetical protein
MARQVRKSRPGKSAADRCCLFSDSPRHLDVSRCHQHDRIELWVNHEPFVLTKEIAMQLGLALCAASVGLDRRRTWSEAASRSL